MNPNTTSGLPRLLWRMGPFVLLFVYISVTFLSSQIACPSVHLLLPPQIAETNAFLAASDASNNPKFITAARQTETDMTAINDQMTLPTTTPKKKSIEAMSCPQATAPDGVCRLEFVHIPKTAGTAIEVAAVMANQTWSVCHWREMFRLGPRRKIYKCPPRIPIGRRRSEGPPFPLLHNGKNIKISLWHLPPIFLQGEKQFPRNPYAENAALFTVVRNPYDRAISEYYSAHDGMSPAKLNVDKLNNAAFMNRFLMERLQWYLKNKNVGDLILFPQEEKKENLTIPQPIYFQADGHYIPQYDYVFYEGQRVIHHVLHFENLQEDFAALMQAYNRTDVKLPQKQSSSSSKSSTSNIATTTKNNATTTTAITTHQETGRVSHVRTLGVENLTDDTIQMIDHIYARDFMAFGYQAKSHASDFLLF